MKDILILIVGIFVAIGIDKLIIELYWRNKYRQLERLNVDEVLSRLEEKMDEGQRKQPDRFIVKGEDMSGKSSLLWSGPDKEVTSLLDLLIITSIIALIGVIILAWYFGLWVGVKSFIMSVILIPSAFYYWTVRKDYTMNKRKKFYHFMFPNLKLNAIGSDKGGFFHRIIHDEKLGLLNEKYHLTLLPVFDKVSQTRDRRIFLVSRYGRWGAFNAIDGSIALKLCYDKLLEYDKKELSIDVREGTVFYRVNKHGRNQLPEGTYELDLDDEED